MRTNTYSQSSPNYSYPQQSYGMPTTPQSHSHKKYILAIIVVGLISLVVGGARCQYIPRRTRCNRRDRNGHFTEHVSRYPRPRTLRQFGHWEPERRCLPGQLLPGIPAHSIGRELCCVDNMDERHRGCRFVLQLHSQPKHVQLVQPECYPELLMLSTRGSTPPTSRSRTHR